MHLKAEDARLRRILHRRQHHRPGAVAKEDAAVPVLPVHLRRVGHITCLLRISEVASRLLLGHGTFLLGHGTYLLGRVTCLLGHVTDLLGHVTYPAGKCVGPDHHSVLVPSVAQVLTRCHLRGGKVSGDWMRVCAIRFKD